MGSERLSHLPKVTQLVRGAGRVGTRAWLRSELELASGNRHVCWCQSGSDSAGSPSLVLEDFHSCLRALLPTADPTTLG